MAGTLVADTLKSSTANPPVFQNASGVEIGQLCRAWVKFVGSTGAISASYNVSSVTRTGTGAYTITMANALADTNYSAAVSTSTINGGYPGHVINSVSTTQLTLQTYALTGTPGVGDSPECRISVFR